MRKGVSNSEPTAMISAFTARSVNENTGRRGSDSSSEAGRSSQAALFRQQRQSLNVPGKMMHRIGGCQNHASTRRKGQSNQAVARDFQTRLAFRRDLYNTALAGERSCDIQVASRVESHALRASEAAIKRVYRPLRIDSMYAVKARSGGPGHKQISVRTEDQMVG